MIKVLACQIAIPPTPDRAARNAHVLRLESLIDDVLAQQRTDLVVLPELATIDYSRDSFGQLAALAEDLDGPSCAAMRRIARRHGTHVVFGMPRRLEADRYRISQIMVGPDGGAPRYYDKIHIAQFGASMEQEYFEAGDHLCVFDIAGLRVAPIICYDIRIPELTRTLCRRHGAELILHCGAYRRDASFYSWHHFVVTRAMENQVWLLSLNRAGERYGGSMLCPPWLDSTTPRPSFRNKEELRILEMDRDSLLSARERYPFLKETRSDYGQLPLSGP